MTEGVKIHGSAYTLGKKKVHAVEYLSMTRTGVFQGMLTC